ncbi:AzlC family ABC transporter permease [Bifidobacterium sp. ESL0704]|uniref:AzlC family ABC transporter permease n=1 Tax=Bifidobacterium sp. ESL0704 TaxID=2983219 RepID=UPI0023F72C76|nr:AzlC family ABC transporter permease [Bifidobacterium sp. ESL0704]WEV52432.1 AzlC family ABC transporter permease [Bifidobacterium sp. ESL0704]
MAVSSGKTVLAAFREAFPRTLPICASFVLTGLSYGLLMFSKGFSLIYPVCMAAFIFAGSMEFVTIDLLLSAFNPFAAFVMTLMVNSRHFFYGLAMLRPFHGLGWKKPLLVFWMCDETFAINSSAKVPDTIDRGWFMLWVSVLDYCYWVSGAALGWLIGGVLPFSVKGVEFAMVAMFVSILLDQWSSSPHTLRGHTPALVGLAVSLACLLAFGPKNFMLPALAGMLVVFLVLRPWLEELKPDSSDRCDGGDFAGNLDAFTDGEPADVGGKANAGALAQTAAGSQEREDGR